jgi:hypothetical protein
LKLKEGIEFFNVKLSWSRKNNPKSSRQLRHLLPRNPQPLHQGSLHRRAVVPGVFHLPETSALFDLLIAGVFQITYLRFVHHQISRARYTAYPRFDYVSHEMSGNAFFVVRAILLVPTSLVAYIYNNYFSFPKLAKGNYYGKSRITKSYRKARKSG